MQGYGNIKMFSDNPDELWLVKVVKLDEPMSKGVQTIHRNGRDASFLLHTPTKLSNAMISVLDDAVVATEIPISLDSPMHGDRTKAAELNPGMEYVEREGFCYLVNYEPRFAVSRLGVVQEQLNVPTVEEEAGVNLKATDKLAAAATAGKRERSGKAPVKSGGKEDNEGSTA